jgi:outer membrane PBP1 activator LpoA protein
VLLPLSGPLEHAGQSVRDGILSGYYGESRRRPEIVFYDTAGNVGGTRTALAKAGADGVQMLLGPLTRDEVAAVFASPDVDVPVIALNRTADTPPPGSTTFALAPEEDGAAAADRLADRGFRRVLAVSQADDGAQRALAAFRQRFQERGGELAGEARVSESSPDYVATLQGAMGGLRPDALFLALKAPAARLLSSQMDAAGLTGVPRVATSLILSGSSLRQDVDLDGIEFPELPWLLGRGGIGLPDSDALGGTLPSAKGGGARLFAFGHDAWKLSAYLDRLLTDPSASISGATGELRLDAMGAVQRAPQWAVFSGGRPRPAMDGALLPEAPTQ